MTIITTKITATGRISVKINDKRSSQDKATSAICRTSMIGGEVTIITDRGDKFTGGFDYEKSCYVFTDRDSKIYTFAFADDAFYNIARGNEIDLARHIYKPADDTAEAEIAAIDEYVVTANAQQIAIDAEQNAAIANTTFTAEQAAKAKATMELMENLGNSGQIKGDELNKAFEIYQAAQAIVKAFEAQQAAEAEQNAAIDEYVVTEDAQQIAIDAEQAAADNNDAAEAVFAAYEDSINCTHNYVKKAEDLFTARADSDTLRAFQLEYIQDRKQHSKNIVAKLHKLDALVGDNLPDEYAEKHQALIDTLIAGERKALIVHKTIFNRGIMEALLKRFDEIARDEAIQLKNIVKETDGSEEDDDDNVFELLPALDELNDVDAGTGNIVTAEIHYSYIDGDTIRTGKAEKSFSHGKDAMHWLNQFNNSNLNYTIDEGTCFRFTNGRVYTVNPADFAEKMLPISDGQSAARFTVKTDGKRNSYYIDGKCTARDKALDACAQMRGDNHFTIGFQTSRYGEDGSLIHFAEHKTMSRIDLKIGVHDDGYSVYFYNGFATAHLFKEYEDAKNCFNQIEQAFFAGKAGVKVNANGQVLVYHAPEIGGTEKINPPEPPEDDFAAKLAALKEQHIRAKCAAEEARVKRDLAESAYNKARDVHHKARLAELNAEDAIDDFLDETAAQLDNQLLGADIFDADIQIITQAGTRLDNVGNILGGLKILATSGEQFAAIANGRRLAIYDTPEQISTAINRLRDSIERGDPEFKFPTVDELENPPTEPAPVDEINASVIDESPCEVHAQQWTISRKDIARRCGGHGLTLNNMIQYADRKANA